MADPLRPALLEILQHSLGLDEHGLYQGAREGYRNHFVTDVDCDDGRACRELVELGLMRERPPTALSDGMPVWCVTDRGREVVAEESPKPRKLTQKRYRAYVASGFDGSFGEYLRLRRSEVLGG